MSMSTNTGGLRQNLPNTFQDNAPNGGRPQPSFTTPFNPGQIQTHEYRPIDDQMLNPIDPGFGVNPMPSPGGNGKGGQFGPGMQPGSPGGKGIFNPVLPAVIGTPGQPGQGGVLDRLFPGADKQMPGFNDAIRRGVTGVLPPMLTQPQPGVMPQPSPGLRPTPTNYRPPNQSGGIMRNRRTGQPINRPY